MTESSPLPATATSTSEDLAFAAWDAGDLRDAFLHFRDAVAEGNERAIMNLAYFHDEGIGTPRSKHDAMRWYLRRARASDSSCASNIAILFRERGNQRAMRRWFARSARQGDGDSWVEVAVCHRDGRGVPRWPARAIAHARQAARSTHITAAGRDEAKEILRALTSAASSTRITDIRDRRRTRILLSRNRPLVR